MENQNKRGGARVGAGRKSSGIVYKTISFKVTEDLKNKIDSDAKKRKLEGKDSFHKEAVDWIQSKFPA